MSVLNGSYQNLLKSIPLIFSFTKSNTPVLSRSPGPPLKILQSLKFSKLEFECTACSSVRYPFQRDRTMAYISKCMMAGSFRKLGTNMTLKFFSITQ